MAFDLGAGKSGKINTLFASTDPSKSKDKVLNIKPAHLRFYDNQPFHLYAGQRFEDMVESIKINGIINPLTVRPVINEDGTPHSTDYEILAGRNRRNAAIEAGLEFVPCIIKEGLSDDDAHLIVIETNLMQRSFTDMTHSEKAAALASHYETLKQQGKRTDLTKEISNRLENLDINEDKATSDSSKIDSRAAAGEKYGLDRGTVARYIQFNKLIAEFKALADSKDLPFIAGVALSYLAESHQAEVYSYITDVEIRISVKQAEAIKQLSKDGTFNIDSMTSIFEGKKEVDKSKAKKASVVIKRKTISAFFVKDETEEEIQSTIIEALSYYFANNEKLQE